MQRRTGTPHDTRGELIDAAWQLFTTRGYDATSVQDVIDKVGVSKGAFYHYFTTKEELLDTVVERTTRAAVAELEPVVTEPSRTAIEKLNGFLAGLRRYRYRHFTLLKDAFRVLLHHQNAIIREKLTERSAQMALPGLTAIIEQGAREGTFSTPDPRHAAETLLYLSQYFGEHNMHLVIDHIGDPHVLDAVRRHEDFTFDAFERLLGAPKGSLERAQATEAEAFVQSAAAGAL